MILFFNSLCTLCPLWLTKIFLDLEDGIWYNKSK